MQAGLEKGLHKQSLDGIWFLSMKETKDAVEKSQQMCKASPAVSLRADETCVEELVMEVARANYRTECQEMENGPESVRTRDDEKEWREKKR